jgi:hypothetical protein
MKIAGHGIEVDLPNGWEGRIYQRDGADPKLHMANFPLPSDDGDFGSTAVATMNSGGVFIDLFEYQPDLANTPLFATSSVPFPVRPEDFQPNVGERPREGFVGLQRFFTWKGRPFCLYIVAGQSSVTGLVDAANQVLGTVKIGNRS